jgi:hypothetical protein
MPEPLQGKIPLGLWQQVYKQAQESDDPQGTIEAFIGLIDNPEFQMDLRELYPQYFDPPQGGSGGGGW